MSTGLLLLILEAIAVYFIVFAVHAARRRYTLVPYYVILGVLTSALRWTADAGISYHVGGLTLHLGSVVFLTSILLGVFLLYTFDGVKATQLGIYTVLAVSLLGPALAYLLRYQLSITDPASAERIIVGPPHAYLVSTAAMLFDFLCLTMLWELCNRYARTHLLVLRIFVCLWVALSLDAVIYATGAFGGQAAYVAILQGNLLSRLFLSLLVAPLLTFYVLWEGRRQAYEITTRPLMAILRQSARTEIDLSAAREEIQSRIQTEEELWRRDAILESVAQAARHLLALSEGFDGVTEILAALGKATKSSRVYLCRNAQDEAGDRFAVEHQAWVRAEGAPVREAVWPARPYKALGIGRWEAALQRGDVIFGNARSFPKEERQQLTSRGTTSTLLLPVFVQTEWWGFLGLDACEGPRRWPRSEVDALRTAAVALGAAIQRARIEAQLRESEERLELALDGGGLGLWDWNLETRNVVFNARWATMLGYAPEEIEGNPLAWQRLIHPEDYENAQPVLRRFLTGELPIFEMEYRMRAKSGDWHWILNRGKVVEWVRPGRSQRAIGTHLDITRLKKTEEALRFSQDMFRLMFEEAPLGFVLCQMDGTYVQANAAYLNIIGYTEEEARTLTYWDVTPEEFAEHEAAQLHSMRTTGRYGPYEKEYRRKGGERIPVVLNGSLVVGADGEEYIWSIVADISERKASERALEEAHHYEREIETRIEETLLRGRPPTTIEGVDIAVTSEATQHMDGDFADFVRLGPRRFDVLVGDVMGKGILAALVGAGAKSHFLQAHTTQLATRSEGSDPSPGALVTAVHDGIVRQLIELERFLTLCYARFDLEQSRITYVDCGHTKTICYRLVEDEVELLAGENVPMGFVAEENYVERESTIAPGDLYFFYSDGITETRNSDGSMFGVDRLIQCIQTYANLDAEELTERVIRTVGRFSGSKTPEDDQTGVAVKIEMDPARRGTSLHVDIGHDVSVLSEARTLLNDYLETNAHLLHRGGDVSGVVLAFVEALSNAMRHADGQDDPITLDILCVRNRLHIGIRHTGAPFHPHATNLPYVGTYREGGYGLYIMNRSFDHIGYDTDRNGRQCITLVKYFPEPSAEVHSVEA